MGNERINEIFDPEIAINRAIAKEHKPYGLKENVEVAKMGGNVAKVARDDLEKKLGKTIISKINTLNYKYLDTTKQLDK